MRNLIILLPQSSVGRSSYQHVQKRKSLVIFLLHDELDPVENVFDDCLRSSISNCLIMTRRSSTYWV